MTLATRRRESGYALLFIFLTIAIIGISLYAAMPRVAFESQRDKEQLLVDRGEQYKRAIQLYFRKLKKYPAKVEDLESTNGQRFLRQRYVDPMTGKDEWRPIHVGPNGVFIDSLTQKNNQKKADPASVNNFITELKAIGNSADTTDNQVNIGLRRRPSDPGGNGGTNPGGVPSPDNVPAYNNGIAAATSDMDLPVVDLNETGQPTGANGNLPNNAGQPNYGNLPAAIAMGAQGSGLNGASNNGIPPQPASGPDVIRNLLTSPRPGGPPPGVFGANQSNDVGFIGDNGSNGLPTPTSAINVGAPGGGFPGTGNLGAGNQGGGLGTPLGGAAGTSVGGGIAGFASKSERPGIKIYNDHSKYNEWEFIYDYAKDKTMGGGQSIPIPQNQTGLGAAIANGVGTGANGVGTAGGASAFGNSGAGTGMGSNSDSGNSATTPSSGSGMPSSNGNASTPSTGP